MVNNKLIKVLPDYLIIKITISFCYLWLQSTKQQILVLYISCTPNNNNDNLWGGGRGGAVDFQSFEGMFTTKQKPPGFNNKQNVLLAKINV